MKNKIIHRISRFYLNEYISFKLCTLCTLFYFIYSMLLYANMIMAIPKLCMTNVSINLILRVINISLKMNVGYFLNSY